MDLKTKGENYDWFIQNNSILSKDYITHNPTLKFTK